MTLLDCSSPLLLVSEKLIRPFRHRPYIESLETLIILKMICVIFVCVLTGLAIAYHIKPMSKALGVILFTHQELTISMYHTRGQVETLTDLLTKLRMLQTYSLGCFQKSVKILLSESCAITIYPLVEILLCLNPLHQFVWRPVTICKRCAQMNGNMWYHSLSKVISDYQPMVQSLSTAVTLECTWILFHIVALMLDLTYVCPVCTYEVTVHMNKLCMHDNKIS